MADSIHMDVRVVKHKRQRQEPVMLSAVTPGSLFQLAGHHGEQEMVYLLLDNGTDGLGRQMGVGRIGGVSGHLTMGCEVLVVRVAGIDVKLHQPDVDAYVDSLEI